MDNAPITTVGKMLYVCTTSDVLSSIEGAVFCQMTGDKQILVSFDEFEEEVASGAFSGKGDEKILKAVRAIIVAAMAGEVDDINIYY